MKKFNALTGLVAATLLLLTFFASAELGKLDKETCVDPSGYETCYEALSQRDTDCMDQCKEKHGDCITNCWCLKALDQLDCAGQSCWNQVYGCDYQYTVPVAMQWCDLDWGVLPFYPPPDNSSAGCSCSVGQLILAWGRSATDSVTCDNSDELRAQIDSEEDVISYHRACDCCGWSSELSAVWDICPSTIPGYLLVDQMRLNDLTNPDEKWSDCGPYMEEWSCEDALNFSSPAGNVTNFYKPDEFPPNGTQGLFNTGVLSSPVSGATYTYTYNGEDRVVTVQSADAKPTGAAGGDSGGEEEEDKDGDGEENGSDEDGDEDAGEMMAPGLWLLVGLTLVAAFQAL